MLMTTPRHRRLPTLAGALLVAVLLAACGSGTPPGSASSTGAPPAGGSSGSASVAGTGAPAVAGAKAALTGLIDMGVQTPYQVGQPFPVTDPTSLDAYAGAFGGIVVNESWSQLEPAPGAEQWAPLDQSLAAVAAWNAAHPSAALGVKLRIFAGHSAPAWVTAQSGTVTIDVHGTPVTMGRWWTPPFESAWRSFQQALAARYDPDPLVRQVSVSSCSSSTGEPFVVSGARASQVSLQAAGWTPQAQEQCLAGALTDYSGWRHTPVTVAFNPLPTSQGPDATFMDQVMAQCATSASSGGPPCIVGNNDLSPDVAQAAYSGPAVAEMQHLRQGGTPPVVYFQTDGARLTCQTISTGLAYDAQSIEVWAPNGRAPGFTVVPAATLAQWNQALRSGTSLAC